MPSPASYPNDFSGVVSGSPPLEERFSPWLLKLCDNCRFGKFSHALPRRDLVCIDYACYQITHLHIEGLSFYIANAMGDHLELLQTEPSYLRRYASIIGQMHLVEQSQKETVGYQMIANEITGDLAMHWFWQGANEELEHAGMSFTCIVYAAVFKHLNDHLSSPTREERSRLDEILYEKLSDYPTIIEVLAAVRMHHPKCSIRTLDEVKSNEDRLAWRRAGCKEANSQEGHFFASSLKRFQKAPLPSGSRDEEWLKKFDASHEALQVFWKSIHGFYIAWIKDQDCSTNDVETLMRPIRMWCDQYRDRLVAKREDVVLSFSKSKKVTGPNDDIFLPLPTEIDIATRPRIPEVKTKLKTRGQETGSATLAIDTSSPTEDSVSRGVPHFCEERNRTVDWDAFVGSMENAGFRGKCGGGSIVIFEKMDRGGKIVFHRPHPNPTLDSVMLQSMGRRLNKWFKWTRDTFLLARK
ncbi:hypothetical protein BU23DRAFT_658017 [Bimuria novae-zelandiae CBS 107.79]|uniref:Uncharacterized protein n=1 Tax=Bimuria novae-zelandiae CBS 107.79 TaxID=1447943 RepID=A0A6A5UT26_9PLEO|nr:hypothetical protein BU23DRAFT_658017 [Bimuria novae-zelandiae CBS 107.79]